MKQMIFTGEVVVLINQIATANHLFLIMGVVLNALDEGYWYLLVCDSLFIVQKKLLLPR